mgnify:CR=1 FL=1
MRNILKMSQQIYRLLYIGIGLMTNLSKEAVIKDLHSMKEKGINRAFIGNIGLSPNEAPYGSVKFHG